MARWYFTTYLQAIWRVVAVRWPSAAIAVMARKVRCRSPTDWITALRAPTIRALVTSGALQLSLFDQRDIASITAPEFPSERLVVCRNPELAAERTRTRQDLLVATERELTRVQARVRRKRDPLRGTKQIALEVGKVVNKYKM